MARFRYIAMAYAMESQYSGFWIIYCEQNIQEALGARVIYNAKLLQDTIIIIITWDNIGEICYFGQMHTMSETI